jgi:hypothetical protein
MIATANQQQSISLCGSLWKQHGAYPMIPMLEGHGLALAYPLKEELGSYDDILDCNFFGYSKTRCQSGTFRMHEQENATKTSFMKDKMQLGKSDTSCMHEQENASQTSAIDICKNAEKVLAIPLLLHCLFKISE